MYLKLKIPYELRFFTLKYVFQGEIHSFSVKNLNCSLNKINNIYYLF